MHAFERSPRTLTKLLMGMALGLLFNQPVAALVIIEDAAARGWIENSGRPFGGEGDSNYIVGNCGFDDCSVGEYRPWFEFEIPSFSGILTSASILIDSETVELFQGPSLTVSFTSLGPGFEFSDIGNGSHYASRTYTAIDDEVEGISITLSPIALTDITASKGAALLIGARASAGAEFGWQLPNQLAFGNSHGRNGGSTRLQLNISDSIPLSSGSTIFLLMIGMTGIYRMRRYEKMEARVGIEPAYTELQSAA